MTHPDDINEMRILNKKAIKKKSRSMDFNDSFFKAKFYSTGETLPVSKS